jgi:LysR family transcriptional regulator, regulator for bpeEF and oprC
MECPAAQTRLQLLVEGPVMDKLRALEYFVAAAEEGSLSAAARRLDVSIQAVAKLVTSLERNLGASLFDRGFQGLTLTADGARYLEGCRPVIDQLSEIDQSMGTAASRPRGEVVVGAPPFALQNCIGPFLPKFHARYPEIELDFRIVHTVDSVGDGPIDVFILFGWPDTPGFVRKAVAQNTYQVLASPGHWAAHPPVQRPGDLERHPCFAFRSPRGVLLDLWEFERGGLRESVKTRGWLSSSHRNMLIDAAVSGEGVIRIADLVARPLVRLGSLVPALGDWHGLDAPPVSVVFRPQHRRTPRIRAVIDFVTEIFRRLEAERGEGTVAAAQRPSWYERRSGRASKLAR